MKTFPTHKTQTGLRPLPSERVSLLLACCFLPSFSLADSFVPTSERAAGNSHWVLPSSDRQATEVLQASADLRMHHALNLTNKVTPAAGSSGHGQISTCAVSLELFPYGGSLSNDVDLLSAPEADSVGHAKRTIEYAIDLVSNTETVTIRSRVFWDVDLSGQRDRSLAIRGSVTTIRLYEVAEPATDRDEFTVGAVNLNHNTWEMILMDEYVTDTTDASQGSEWSANSSYAMTSSAYQIISGALSDACDGFHTMDAFGLPLLGLAAPQ